MKRIELKQMEYADISIVYEFTDMYPDVIVDGNRHFTSYTTDLYDNIKEYCVDSYYMSDEFYDIEMCCNDVYDTYKAVVDDLLNVNVSATQARQIKEILEKDYRDKFIIRYILNIITGMDYEWHTLRGYIQSDWQDALIPKKDQAALKDIEAVYMGLYQEYCITVYEDAEEIECYLDFVMDYVSYDEMKERYAADNDVDVENVKILTITGYRNIPVYGEVA